MANRSILCKTAMVLAALATIPCTLAQSHKRVNATDSMCGISTDRLTSKQLRIWREVQKIAEAADKVGQLLHPRLHGLWQRVQSSGHTVIIEMKERQADADVAGTTTLQEPNPDGDHKVIYIWLHIWAIDGASVHPSVRRSDGLLKFDRLGKHERYAEVLGHELTHAVLLLENPEYARLCLEYGSAAARIMVRRKHGRNPADDQEMVERRRLQSLAERIEKPAQSAELEIWRELLSGQGR